MVTRSKDSKYLVRGDQELDDIALDLSVISVESAKNSGSNCSNVLNLNISELKSRHLVNISHISNNGNEPVGKLYFHHSQLSQNTQTLIPNILMLSQQVILMFPQVVRLCVQHHTVTVIQTF